MPKFELHVGPLYSPKRLDAYLTETFAGRFSRRELKEVIDQELVFLNGRPARPRDAVREGDRIEGSLPPEVSSKMAPENIPVQVIFEDEWILVVDKPAGMVVHPGVGNKKGTLVHALLGRGQPLSDAGDDASRPGIVHRLDKDTSGVLIVAKDNRSHRVLQDQFSSRTLSKTYLALVKGRVEYEEGHVEKPIGHDPKVREKMAVTRRTGARDARTRYRVLERFRHATLLEVHPETGRTHQIRVHLAHIGHPVLGDVLYGGGDGKWPRLALHAARIEFSHPKTGKLVEFESPLPPDMEAMVQKARVEGAL